MRVRVESVFVMSAIAMVALSLLLAKEGAEKSRRAQQTISESQGVLAKAASTARIPPMKSDANAEKMWGNLRAERDFDWEPIFRSLEGTNLSSIELLGFTPDKINRTVTIRGEARERGEVLKYLAELSLQPNIKSVHLVQISTKKALLETHPFEAVLVF